MRSVFKEWLAKETLWEKTLCESSSAVVLGHKSWFVVGVVKALAAAVLPCANVVVFCTFDSLKVLHQCAERGRALEKLWSTYESLFARVLETMKTTLQVNIAPKTARLEL
eukprot:683172-Amphidinium_carterae.1